MNDDRFGQELGGDDVRLARAALRLLAQGEAVGSTAALPAAPGTAAREQAEAQARALWRRHLADRRRRLERRLSLVRVAAVGVAVAIGAGFGWDGAGAVVRGAATGAGLDSPALLVVFCAAAALATCCGFLYRAWVEA